MGYKKEIRVFLDEKSVVDALAHLLKELSLESEKVDGNFFIGFSGGSCVKLTSSALSQFTANWSRWHVYFCDERKVDFSSDDSTYGAYKKLLLPKIPALEDRIAKIETDVNLSTEAVADNYEKCLVADFGRSSPVFDALILGLGPDGHTCSLFPGHPLLKENARIVAPITDSPKPPKDRVTLTIPVLNSAKHVIFVAMGGSKADVLKDILENPNSELPGALVKPATGTVHWLLDKQSARKLSSQL